MSEAIDPLLDGLTNLCGRKSPWYLMEEQYACRAVKEELVNRESVQNALQQLDITATAAIGELIQS
jgi:hypothetical protein